MPVAREDVLGEEADAAGAEAQGSGGEAVNVFPVQAGVLQLLFGEQGGGFVGALRQQADFPDLRCLSPFALATELESGNHVLTQWGQEPSPFMS